MMFGRSALALALSIWVLIGGSSVAAAHTELDSSVPVDGAVLSAAPTKVVLIFNEALLGEAVGVAISNSGGAVVGGAVPTTAGAVVTISWPTGLPPDTYTVSYRIASVDAHPVTGSVGFVITAVAGGPAGAATSAATPAPKPSDPVSAPGGPIAVVGLILALTALVAVIALARRGRR